MLVNILIAIFLLAATPLLFLSCRKLSFLKRVQICGASALLLVGVIIVRQMYLLPKSQFVSIKTPGAIAKIKFALLTTSILQVDLCAYSSNSDPKIDSMFWEKSLSDSALCKWKVKTMLTSWSGLYLDAYLSEYGINGWSGTSINRLVCRNIWYEKRSPGLYVIDVNLDKIDSHLLASSGFIRVFQPTY